MTSQPLRIMIDDQVMSLFIQSCRDPQHRHDAYPDDDLQSSRLLIMLAAAGEFRVLTTADSLQRLCTSLEAEGATEKQIGSIAQKLSNVLEVTPLERVSVEQALRMGPPTAPFALRTQRACAATAHVHALVTPSAPLLADSEHVMTPRQFFQKVRERYGFDYACLAL